MTGEAPPFVETGCYPTRDGNLVLPLIDGEPAFRRICAAIEAAQRSVWVTVTFMWDAFRMPDGRGTALDVLDRAAARGVDVRVIFWRPDDETADLRTNAFWGSPAQRELLVQRRSGVKIRWDRAHPGFCQHQKSWLIDAGEDDAVAFVGGINLNPHSMAAPGHDGEGQNHDVYVEIAGPCIADVHHNFAQRWNEASERRSADGIWGEGSATDLEFPGLVPAPKGRARMQIQRTTHPDRYADGRPAPGVGAYPIERGELTNLRQYCAAIGGARDTIYIENQYLEVREIVDALHAALARGVAVALVMPNAPIYSRPHADAPERKAFLEARAALASFERFTLAGLAGRGADGGRTPVYVHAKLMLIDDCWATVGSCNLHRYSLFGNGELNAAFRDPTVVRAFRVALIQEHTGEDTGDLDARAALELFAKISKENRARREAGDPQWRGLAFSLDISVY